MIGTLLESMPENQENHECRIDIPTGGNAPALNLSIIEISSHTEASNVGPNEVQSNTGNSSPVWTGIRARFLQWLQYSWTHIEGVFTLSKIVACIVVLIVARHEKPKAPLFAWVVIYAVACASYLPVLYKYQILLPGRLFGLVNNYYTKTIDVIFVLWYIICSYWVFRYHATAAPNLLRLCTAFLTFGFIGYAMPFIGLAIVIYFNSGILDEINTASAETIRALPTYKYKLQRNGSRNMESDSEGEVGVVAAGTEKERVISGDDAVCCICLVTYADNDKLKELPCSHLFHSKCVDKWLKIKSICPLCKCSIGESNDG